MSAQPQVVMQGRVHRGYYGFASHLRGGAREALHKAIRWLNPQAPDVVRIEPLAPASNASDAATQTRTIRRQVASWRGRVRRARGSVVLRRYLALALGLAVLGAVIARLAGPETHPLWAFAGVAIALVGVLVALAMPIPEATVAPMLDHGLDLFDRVTTALELETRTKGSPLLAAKVVAEAQEELGASFRTAQATSRQAGWEWGVGLGLAVLLALLVALPSFGHARPVGAPVAHHGVGSARGRTHHRGAVVRPRPGRRNSSRPVGAGLDNNHFNSEPPLAISPSGSSSGTGPRSNPYGPAARSIGGRQIAQTGLSETATGTRNIVTPGSGQGGKPGSSAGGNDAARTGSAGTNSSGSESAGGQLHAPSGAGSSSRTGVHAGGRGGGTPGQQGAPASNGGSHAGQSQRQQAPPGGENAGASRGSTQSEAGLAPDLSSGSTGLPLQAGYAPTAARKPGHGGVSQTPNGGGGPARSQSAGGAGGGGAGQAGATPIQPTPNAGAVGTQSVVSSYFGGANQLQPGSW